MLKNCVIAMCLPIIGSAFWLPAEVHAQYLNFKCPAGTVYNLTTKKCQAAGQTVDTEGDGNTQGGKTTVVVAVQPDNDGGVFLQCRNKGGTIGNGKAFLPRNIKLFSQKATKPNFVDKKGKFLWFNDGILPPGVHPEFTPAQCANDPQCAEIQVFCPNGGFTGSEGKNWVPIDVTPIKMLMQGFLYFCDNDKGVHVCNCDPTLDADLPISATSGPANRCASATKENPSPQDFTFAWTEVNGDGSINHRDIRPFVKTPVKSCELSDPETFTFDGQPHGYGCEDTTLPDLFP